MSKTNVRWIDFGNGTDQVSSRSVPAFYTPINYTPAQIATEGNDKISAHLKGIDDALAGVTPSPSDKASANFVDQLYTGDGIIVDLESCKKFVAESLVDAYLNGRKIVEDSDYNRDVANQNFSMLDDLGSEIALYNNAIFRLRVFNSLFTFNDETFIADGIVTEYTVSASIDDNSVIDVMYNGLLQRENKSWERDSVNNKIKTIDGSPSTPFAAPNLTRVEFRKHGIEEFADEYFVGGVATVTPRCLHNFGNKIDVYINGRFVDEGVHWTRAINTQVITIVDGATVTTSDTEILVRIWNL